MKRENLKDYTKKHLIFLSKWDKKRVASCLEVAQS